MRKAVFIVAGILFLYTAGAQNKIHFQIALKPNLTYQNTSDEIVNIEADLKGDNEALKNSTLKQGDNKRVIHTQIRTVTGSLINDSVFPVKTTYEAMDISGHAGIPPGTTIYGTCTKAGKLNYDSLDGKDLDMELRTKLLPMLSNFTKNVTFVEHNLKVGDTVMQEMPLSLPIGPVSLSMIINSIYTLKSIKGGYAYFDIVMQYKAISESVSIPINMKGTGTGSMVYDIENSYYSGNTTTSTLVMSAKSEDRAANAKIETTSIQKITITKR